MILFVSVTDCCLWRCSRTHDIPEDSCTLLFPGMYANFELEQSMRDEYDTGLFAFLQFYFDVVATLNCSSWAAFDILVSFAVDM